MACVIAIDAGTTGVRSPRRSTTTGAVRASRVPGVPAALPAAGLGRARRRSRSGDAVRATLGDVVGASSTGPSPPSASPTSARRSSPGTGAPGSRSHRAIVWQDRRTADRCDELRRRRPPRPRARAHRPRARPVLLGHQDRVAAAPRAASPAGPDLALGTIDSWVLWNLTGGAVHATDPSNASRTMLFDIGDAALERRAGDAARRARSAPCPRCGRRAAASASTADGCGVPAGIPVSGIAGDQQAALFGQACFDAGHDQEHLRHRQLRAA